MASDTQSAKKPGAGGMIIAIVLVAIIGGGAGAAFSLFVSPAAQPPTAKASDSGHEAAAPDPHAKPKEEKKVESSEAVVDLAPIHVSLGTADRHKLRFDASLVLKAGGGADATVLSKRIASDILVYLRTLSIDQIDSAAGLEFVREDVLEIAQLRSKGEVTDVLLRSLMLE